MTVEQLTDSLRETLEVFDDSDPSAPLTTSEVADRLGIGRRSTYDRLQRLADRDRLATKKVGARGRVWWRPEPSSVEGRATNGTNRAVGFGPVGGAFDGVDAGLVVVDEDLEVVWLNEAYERYFGLDREEAVGRDRRALVEERVAPAVADPDAFEAEVLATDRDVAETDQSTCRVVAGEGREERRLTYRREPIDSGPYAGGHVELYRDVTEERETTGALGEPGRRYRSLVQAVGEYAIYRLDPDGRVRTWNEGARRIEGYESDAILGEHVATFYTDDDRSAGLPEEHLADAATDGVVEEEGWRVRGDGSRFWARVTVSPIYDDDGDLRGYAQITRDTTDRREREQAVRRERDRLQQVLETAPVGVGVFDTDGTVDGANARLAEFPVPPSDGRPADASGDREMLDPDGDPLPDVRALAERVVETAEPVTDREVRVERPGDETRWISVNAVPITAGDGTLDRVVTTATDVTPFRERVRRLERQRDDLQSTLDEVYERITDAFYALDTDWRFTHLNEQAEELLGKTAAELRGEYVWEEFPNAAENSYKERFERAMETQEPVTFETYSTVVDAWIEVQVYPSPTGLSVYFRDVSERKERERALEQSERRYRALAENFPNGAVVMFDEDLRYTLVEGDLPKDLGVEDEWVGERVDDVVRPEAREAFAGPYRAALEGESSSFEVEYGDRILHVQVVPIRDADGEVVAGMGMSQDVTDRREHERQIEHHRQQLTALNNLNDLVHGITDAVIEQSTREEIEAIVCERLAASDSYQHAWIGDVDVPTLTVQPRAEAGVEGYLDEVTLTIDPDDEQNNGATARAALQREVQVTRDTGDDPRDDNRREHSREYGFRSSAAIPIVHDDTMYDVLNVYTDRPNAFTDQELDVIGRVGEIVGHAIAAVERKRALMSDDVVELELQIRDVLESIGVSADVDGTITFDRTIPVGDGVFNAYGTATGDGMDAIEAVIEAETHPHWKSVSVLDTDGEETRFELRLTESPVVSTVASHGGYVEEARIEDGDYYLQIHLTPSTDVRHVVDVIEDAYPPIELVTHRQVSREQQPIVPYGGTPLEELTERQRSAIEAAYERGYFDWPRESTGEEVADLLGVTPSTFHQHLRKAERHLFAALFGERRVSR